jgi:cobalt-precorrin 5A hydrolase
VPVITTATDVQGLPALDVIAPRLGLALDNPGVLKDIHMALLGGRPVPLADPEGLLREALAGFGHLFDSYPDLEAALSGPGTGVYAGWEERQWPPGWLRLRPKNLVAGLGCHLNTPVQEILEFIQATFQAERLSLKSLKALATVARKQHEPGLVEAARQLGVEFLWFTESELQAIPVPHPSAQVAKHLGVASVSEAAALKAAGPGAILLVSKRKTANATLAVARAV